MPLDLEVKVKKEKRTAIVDIGSNSIRLVIFDGVSRSPRVLIDEKAQCSLAAGLAKYKSFKSENLELAYKNLYRFAAVMQILEVEQRFAIATSATREAKDGLDFANQASEILGTKVEIIEGHEEARLSALGVISEFPNASGIVADLGGGSLEFACIDSGRISKLNSLLLGYQSLIDQKSSKKFSFEELSNYIKSVLKTISDQYLDNTSNQQQDLLDNEDSIADSTKFPNERTLYLVGGKWKRLARLDMALINYPIKIVSAYELTKKHAKELLLMPKDDHKNITLEITAVLLKNIIKQFKITKVIFTSAGIREGYLYSILKDHDKREEPIYRAICKIAKLSQAKVNQAKMLEAWIWQSNLINDFELINLDFAKCISGMCLLTQVFLYNNKEQKAVTVFNDVLNLNIPNLSHLERVFMAYTMYVSHAATKQNKEIRSCLKILDPRLQNKAKKIGFIILLAKLLAPTKFEILKFIEFYSSCTKISLRSDKYNDLLMGSMISEILLDLNLHLGL